MNSIHEKSLDAAIDDLSKFYILLLLREGSSHGYGIMTKYRRRTGQPLSAGTLYPYLQWLEAQGIVSHDDKPVGKRPRRVYQLTTPGRKAVNQLFRRFASITSGAFNLNTQICANCGCKLYEGGHEEEIDGQVSTFCCPHCASAYKRQMDSAKV